MTATFWICTTTPGWNYMERRWLKRAGKGIENETERRATYYLGRLNCWQLRVKMQGAAPNTCQGWWTKTHRSRVRTTWSTSYNVVRGVSQADSRSSRGISHQYRKWDQARRAHSDAKIKLRHTCTAQRYTHALREPTREEGTWEKRFRVRIYLHQTNNHQ